MGIRMTMQIEGRNIKWHNEHRGRQRKNNLFLVLYDVSQLIPEYGKFLKIIRELCVAKTIQRNGQMLITFFTEIITCTDTVQININYHTAYHSTILPNGISVPFFFHPVVISRTFNRTTSLAVNNHTSSVGRLPLWIRLHGFHLAALDMCAPTLPSSFSLVTRLSHHRIQDLLNLNRVHHKEQRTPARPQKPDAECGAILNSEIDIIWRLTTKQAFLTFSLFPFLLLSRRCKATQRKYYRVYALVLGIAHIFGGILTHDPQLGLALTLRQSTNTMDY